MLGFLSAYDENEKQAQKEKIFFVSVKAQNEEDIKIEMSPLALKMARTLNLNKVYLFCGKDIKIEYDYSL